jgi:deoxyribodipyrimidine photo-lyase
MRNIFWFRRDLRLEDNIGLYHALKDSSEVIPVFIIDPDYLKSSDSGDARIYFLFDGIRELGEELNGMNAKLLIRSGNPASELVKLARETNSQGLYFNQNYEPYEISRDDKVTDGFSKAGLKICSYRDQIIFDREVSISAKKGIINFSGYKKRWLSKLKSSDYKPKPIPKKNFLKLLSRDREIYSLKYPNPQDFNFNLEKTYWHGGELQAKKAFDSFFKSGIFSSSLPDCLVNRDGLFNIFPYLRFGNLSIRKILTKLMQVHPPEKQADYDKWLENLVRNDYYTQILLNSSSLKDDKESLNQGWSNTYPHFFAWCSARTGYPAIDAALTQLNNESWLPPNLKKLAATFLVKKLRLDYRWGEKYFMHKLVDGDEAVNSAEWKAVNSGKISTDLISESKLIDPSGEYIKMYLPQLKDVPEIYIHEPYKMPVSLQKKLSCIIGKDYPVPIINISGKMQKNIYLYKSRE